MGAAGREGYSTRSGQELGDAVDKTFSKIAKDAKKNMADVQRTVGPTLEATFEAIKELSKASKDASGNIQANVNKLEEQANTLKKLRNQMEGYSDTLSDMGVGISEVSEDVLKVLQDTIERTDKIIRRNSTNALANYQNISVQMQKGLRDSFKKSGNLWDSYNKSVFTRSKKFYADQMEEEQRSMEERVRWMEDYRKEHYDRLTEAEKDFFDNEFEEYKKRAEELEDLVRVAGTEISNSFSNTLRSMMDDIRDIAIVSAAREALGSDIDSYIENKHQLLARTGQGFDYSRYRRTVNNAPLNSNILSRNEYSEIYSDMVKDLRVQDLDIVSNYAQDMAEQYKAYGMSVGSLDRIFWTDKNAGMEGRSYRQISNIAAALEDNENLYVDASKLLTSINDQIDNIAYMQYEDGDTFSKMRNSLAVIEAVSESSAMKGTEDLMNAMKEMGSNRWDMMDNDFAKHLAAVTGRSMVDLESAFQNGTIGDVIKEYQNYFKSMDDATLAAYVKSGKTPWSSFAAAKEFTNDNLDEYIDAITTSIQNSENLTKSLTEQKAEDSNTWFTGIKNYMSGTFGRFGDLLGEFDVNMINLAAAVTVAESVGSIFQKLSNTPFGQMIGNTTVVRGIRGFFTKGITKIFPKMFASSATQATTSALTSSATSTAVSTAVKAGIAESGLLPVVGYAATMAGGIAAIGMAAHAAYEQNNSNYVKEHGEIQKEHLYDDKGFKVAESTVGQTGMSSKGGTGVNGVTTNVGAGGIDYDKIVEFQKAWNSGATSGVSGTDLDDANDPRVLSELWKHGFIGFTDNDGDGKIDEYAWLTKEGRFDQNRMYIADDGVYLYNPTDDSLPGTKIDGTHANGLDYVPYDGYIAELHKGEAVLTADQANGMRSGSSSLDRLRAREFESDLTENFTSTLFLLRNIRDILQESFLIDQGYYEAEEKSKRDSIFEHMGSAASGGGILGRVGSAAKKVLSGELNPVDAAKALLLGEDNASVERTGNTNSAIGSIDDFRIQDLGSWSVPNIEDMKNWVASIAPDSPFIENMQAFLDAAAKTGLDPRYLVAHAGLESDWGRDYKAVNSNNYFGYGAFDSNVKNMYKYSYDTFAEGIEGIAEKIASGYYNAGQQSLYQMRWNGGVHQYATGATWDTSIADILRSAPENTEYRSIYDEPVAKVSENTGDYLKTALGELGYTEGRGNETKYGEWIGSNYAPWCASFVSWALDQGGLGDVLQSSTVSGIMSQAMEQGMFHYAGDGYMPQSGDIFVNKNGGSSHVGFVLDTYSDGSFSTVEGNSSDAVKSNIRSMDDYNLTGFVSMQDYQKSSVADTVNNVEDIPQATASSVESVDVDTASVEDTIVREVGLVAAKLDAVIALLGRSKRTTVAFNDDMSYVYSR